MRKWKKVLCFLIGGVVICLLSSLLLITITPYPICQLTRIVFSGGADGVSYGLPSEFAQMSEMVSVYNDKNYSSSYEHATYDLYVPKDTTKTYPLLLWIHGGAFIGGDKKDIASFATALSSKGYAVLCMNYALAPENGYPIPLYQSIELSKEIEALSLVYPIDNKQLFIGGDSAGAHIALQFVLTQVNETYREYMHLQQTIPITSLRGYLSYCGLLDIHAYDETDSFFSNFLYNQSAWGYFNKKDWKQTLDAQGADLFPYLDSSFPPVYLTDGDMNSFLSQAQQFKEILIKQQVEVNDLLWESGNHPHEYQFHLDQEAGSLNFQSTIEFLDTHTNGT